MKRKLFYILISLVVLIGFIAFIPVKKVFADDYSLNGALGTCTLSVGPPMHWTWNTCFKDNPGQNWKEDTGTCVLHNLSYNTCTDPNYNSGTGASSVKANPTDPKWKDDTNGDCTFQGWTDTSCHNVPSNKNGPGTFTPFFSGTPPLTGTLPLGTCSVTHVSTSGCQSAGGQIDSTIVDSVTAGSGGGTCVKQNVTQVKCATSGGGFWNTIGGSWGGTPVATWYSANTYTPGTVALIDTSSYTLLAPLPNGSSGQLSTIDTTGTTALGDYLNIMLKIFIGICAVLAVIMVLMGGIEYMTSELVSSKEAGKERIRDAIFGLILAIGAWLLLNTINPNLLRTDFSSLGNVAADEQLGGESTAPFIPANIDTVKSAGFSCPGNGGKGAVVGIAQSFIGKTSYTQDAGKRNTFSGSTYYGDCSSTVDQIYTCAGLPNPGGNTGVMFGSCQHPVNGNSFDFTTLHSGDLVGWTAGQGGKTSGHVAIYIGNGQIIDNEPGGTAVRNLSQIKKWVTCVKWSQ